MASPLLLQAARRLEIYTTLRERLLEVWTESAPGTDDGDRIWRAYEDARTKEDAALRSFFSLWRATEKAKDAPLEQQLEQTLEWALARKREVGR